MLPRYLQSSGSAVFLYKILPRINPMKKGGFVMGKEKEKEEKSVPWEVADPKPPVIRSGHMEGRYQN